VQKSNSFLAIIPARKGSKGIIGKNLKKIGGKPMIQYTIEAAMSAFMPDNIIISTDDDNVIRLAGKHGLEVPFVRPDILSSDSAKNTDVIQHSIDWYIYQNKVKPINIILLQPTSPFRDLNDINNAIKKYKNSDKKTLVSVSEPMQHPGDCLIKDSKGCYKRLEISQGLSQRQSFPEVFFIDGGIYISETKYFLETQNIIGDDPEIFKMDQSHSLDIDTPFDLELARAIFNSGHVNDE